MILGNPIMVSQITWLHAHSRLTPPGAPRQDPRLAGRPSQQDYRSERSRTPPRRDAFRDNHNPYRDERRDDARRGNGYSRERSRSPPRGGARGGTFSPQQRDRAPYSGGGGGGQRDDDNQETIMVESSLVGLVIGRQGENLRRIETDSGTRIQFITGPTESGPQRQCRISGPPRARMDAKREIYRIIDENGGNVPKDLGAPGRAGSSNGSQAGARGARSGSNQPPLREGENSIQIMVPDRTVGLIIGRGGETIRDLQERSGCHINIVGENKSVNGLRPVNLIGSAQAAGKAKELILEIVESDTRSQEAGGVTAAPAGRAQPERRQQQQHGGDNMDGKITETVHVPSDSVGMIIGKGGETIKQMQNDTGCKINVQQAQGRDVERPIDLVGSAQAVEAAKQAIWEKVDQVVCIFRSCFNSLYQANTRTEGKEQ
jgi:far upstream element-binding protein